MSAPATIAVDLLEDLIERVRPLLLDGQTKRRVRLLWSAAKLARNLAASDVVHDRFMRLAVEVGLIDRRGWWLPEDVRGSIRRHGREDISHMIDWAQRGLNPFETGSLQ